MLQESIDDAADPDVVADAGEPGPQCTNASADDVDAHACLARPIERLDDSGLQQTVHLGHDPALLAFPKRERI